MSTQYTVNGIVSTSFSTQNTKFKPSASCLSHRKLTSFRSVFKVFSKVEYSFACDLHARPTRRHASHVTLDSGCFIQVGLKYTALN